MKNDALVFVLLKQIGVKKINLVAVYCLDKNKANSMTRFYSVFILIFLFCISIKAQNHILPFKSDSVISIAIVKNQNAEYKEVIEMLSNISELSPSYSDAIYNIAKAYLLNKEYPNAIEVLQKFLDKNPEVNDAKYGIELLRASILSKNDKLTSELTEKLLKKYPNHGFLYELLGLHSFESKNFSKAEEYFIKLVHQMPLYSKAYIYLGMTSFEQGNLSLGTLSMLMSLFVEPSSEKLPEIMASLNKNLTKPHADIDNYTYYKNKFESFIPIETIIRKRLAISKDYDNELGIEEDFLNQIHALLYSINEYQPKEGENNFYTQYYIPFFKQVMQDNHYKASILYSLQDIKTSDVIKSMAKNKKEYELFAKWIEEKGFYFVTKRNNNFDGSSLAEPIYYLGSPQIKEVAYIKDQNIEGKSFFVDIDNSEIFGEANYTKGELDGKMKTFYPNKKLKEEVFFSQGERDGVYKSYYETGNVKETYNYNKGILDGVFLSYFPSGDVECKINFKEGLREGEAYCMYSNGKKYWETNYQKNYYNGIRKEYLVNGQLKDSAFYKEGVITEEQKYYHNNGMLSALLQYKDGKQIGKQSYFHENGKPSSETNFSTKNKIENNKKFNYEGVLISETSYKNDELDGIQKHYHFNGKPSSDYEYKNGDISYYTPYDLEGKPLFDKKNAFKNNKEITFYNAIGNIISKGVQKKGNKIGVWDYYRQDKVILTETFDENGKKDGVTILYYPNGELKKQIHYKNDLLDGAYTQYFANGNVAYSGKYVSNEPSGEFRYYTDKGALVEKRFFDETEGTLRSSIYYDLENRPLVQYWYDENRFVAIQDLWSGGEKVVFSELNDGKHEIGLFNKNQKYVVTIRNGLPNGTNKIMRKDGVLIRELSYQDGLLDGEAKWYNAMGSLDAKSNFIQDQKWGKYIDYDYNMNVNMKSDLVNGDDFGTELYLYANGKKFIETNHFDDENFSVSYYDSNEKLLFTKFEIDNEIVKIEYPDNSKEIPKNGQVEIEIKNDEGKLILRFSIKNGCYSGEYLVNYADGSPYVKKSYKNDMLEGEYLEYYQNGKLYKKNNYFMGNLSGESLVYYPNGKIRAKMNYENDDLFGNSYFYDERGVLNKTITYQNGYIVEIK